jgi:hypothetical protein
VICLHFIDLLESAVRFIWASGYLSNSLMNLCLIKTPSSTFEASPFLINQAPHTPRHFPHRSLYRISNQRTSYNHQYIQHIKHNYLYHLHNYIKSTNYNCINMTQKFLISKDLPGFVLPDCQYMSYWQCCTVSLPNGPPPPPLPSAQNHRPTIPNPSRATSPTKSGTKPRVEQQAARAVHGPHWLHWWRGL